jgi:hypothetical protein
MSNVYDNNRLRRPVYTDSFGFLRTALTGVTTWTDRVIRNTGVVVPHIAKNDVFTYNIQFPHSKDIGTAIVDFHLHYMPVTLPSAGQVIAIDYSWAFVNNNNGAIPDTLNGGSGTTLLPLSATDQYKLKVTNIVTGMATGTETYSGFLLVRCVRRNDGQDTYAGEIALLGADAHYLTDRFGSFEPYTD